MAAWSARPCSLELLPVIHELSFSDHVELGRQRGAGVLGCALWTHLLLTRSEISSFLLRPVACRMRAPLLEPWKPHSSAAH